MDGVRVSIDFMVEVPENVAWPAQVRHDAELLAAIHGYPDPQPAELVERLVARVCEQFGLRVFGMASGYVVPSDGAMCAEGGLS